MRNFTGIYLNAKENSGKPQLGYCLMEAVQPFIASNGVPSLQMSIGSHSTAGRDSDRKKELRKGRRKKDKDVGIICHYTQVVRTAQLAIAWTTATANLSSNLSAVGVASVLNRIGIFGPSFRIPLFPQYYYGTTHILSLSCHIIFHSFNNESSYCHSH